MDITTGVFTAITGGYYMITYGGRARVRIGHPMGQEAHMYIFRNGGEVIQESIWQSEINLQDIHIETGVDYIDDQGSRTVVGHKASSTLEPFGMVDFYAILMYIGM